MHENKGGAVPKGTLDSDSIAGCKLVYKINKNRMQEHLVTNPSGSKLPFETGRNIVDCRILGVSLSAVEQQDTHRKDKIVKLIEKFENHPNKESFLQDFKQTKEINEFSMKSQDLIAEMNNTEIFELCETSSKQQCPDCNLYWEAGIVPLYLWKMLENIAE